MKTSHILLAIIMVITLTGMVATDVLLKRQYEKVDWNNPYQDFERRSVPTARHWVVDATPTNEIVIIRSLNQPQALIRPDQVPFVRIRQQGDTAFVTFTSDSGSFRSYRSEPRDEADYELGNGLVLRLPNLQSLRVKDGRVTLRDFAADSLSVGLQHSRLRTDKRVAVKSLDLAASQHSFAVMGADRYRSLRFTVRDSSGIELNNTQAEALATDLSPKAEVLLRGQALRWLK